MPEHGLDLDIFRKSFHDFNHLKPDKAFIQHLKKGSLLLTPRHKGDLRAPDIPYEAILKKELGTDEGSRRFERIDRVSLDVSKDNFDKLKIEGNNERVYDVKAQIASLNNSEVTRTVTQFDKHLNKSLLRYKEKDKRWQNFITLKDEDKVA